MAEIVLFHSALGLRPGVAGFADALRTAGHTVHTPDLFDGRVFEDLDAGVAYRDEVGIDEIAWRTGAAVKGLPAELVYAGFSLGAGSAQFLAQARPGARAALLMHGALPSDMFGRDWPHDVPIEVHAMDADPWVDLDVARALVAEADRGALHLYPGDGHLFSDPDDPGHDARAAALMLERALAFLDTV